MSEHETAHFGFKKVSPQEKTRRVAAVFDSVSGRYDLMNDLLSLGMHRMWKRLVVARAAVRPGMQVLDLAGGTGDIAMAMHRRLRGKGQIVLCDINAQMLENGRKRLFDQGICAGVEFVQGDAECLPFADGKFDVIVISFGLRNFTHKEKSLRCVCEKLRYGGQLIILECSKFVGASLFASLYEIWSFECMPRIGRWVAEDEASYRYLVESIRRHPDQQELSAMMCDAGFDRVSHVNLSGGIVAIHTGYRL
ncbi:MAG: class I SAM-dependent methyltransferase [Candidatus Eutrophobiaceae bacterium]